MRHFKFLRFNPHGDNAELITKLALCYQEVFSTLPWGEWKKCPVCEKKWGLEEKEELSMINFSHCNESVIDFWPYKEVISDIQKEVTKYSSCWVILYENNVIGFTWGYPINTLELEKKLQINDLSKKIQQFFGQINVVAYKDEIGIKKEFRGQGIAQELFQRRINDFREMGLEVVLSRTKKNPPAITYLWYTKLGFKEIAHYNDVDERVVLGARLHQI
jgi:GNAT superfamily N-acetyltransferase